MSELNAIENSMREMLDGNSRPYDAGWLIWQTAMKGAKESPDLMWPLWLIWGALTDRFELDSQGGQAAEKAMIRASSEWLALKHDDSSAKAAYLDRWVYEESGYERKSGHLGSQ
ncbi:MAG: hypothetical protein V4488_16755 [Pseudomonadota bacterium]